MYGYLQQPSILESTSLNPVSQSGPLSNLHCHFIRQRNFLVKNVQSFIGVREGGVGGLDPIHNFGTHFLCTKSYGILGSLWSTFLECFWKVLYFLFFVFEGGEWGGGGGQRGF